MREDRSISIAAGARGLGVSPPYLAKLERHGTAKAPDLALLHRVATLYDLPIHELLFEAGYAFEIDPGVVHVLHPDEQEAWTSFEQALREVPIREWEFLAPHKPGAPSRIYKLFLRPMSDSRRAWWAFEGSAEFWGPDEPQAYYREATHAYRGSANLLALLQPDSEASSALVRALRLAGDRLTH